ncbi:hypothetical protein [Lysobacter capsici]|uniref:hypothetical protein n=1 Tax=Lysobacter capsici TaxID=435897 RepID=UPI00398D03DA
MQAGHGQSRRQRRRRSRRHLGRRTADACGAGRGRDRGAVRDIQAAPARAIDAATASFDAKGSLDLVVEPAGKSISEKGVSSTKSR